MSRTNRNSFRPLAPVGHELLRLGLGTLIHQVQGLRVALEDPRSQLFHLLVRRMRWNGRHFRIASDIQTRTVGLSTAGLIPRRTDAVCIIDSYGVQAEASRHVSV